MRIRHIPTGIALRCQQERSQAQNKVQSSRCAKLPLMHMALSLHGRIMCYAQMRQHGIKLQQICGMLIYFLGMQARALELLKAKLLVVQQEQQAQEIAEIRGDMVKAEWGQQIRNYVFHPYKLVKDVRTGVETSDVSGIMDGDLEQFTQAYLRHRSSQ